jgi:hypothetical protein
MKEIMKMELYIAKVAIKSSNYIDETNNIVIVAVEIVEVKWYYAIKRK